ncbi:inorganic phosphate transporter 1-4-like [Senna tora]|uniref:Inorganic phosphate transporter 1-4-like n=1 Tax=Senna tora TaxID=362788 RepID=A0A834WXJ3_9FABA|nr:inorganic phosphate transporter 1-4-like [Senna tora]
MGVEELKVLKVLDSAKTQWYHFTAIVIAGMGFFTDSYDLFCISLVTKLLGRLYYYTPGSAAPGALPFNVTAAINGVAFCGTLVGQLFFGWLGDKMGRKRVYGVTLLLMVVSSIASALSFGSDAKAVMATLCFFRFWLGFGIGGDYPLSATIMAEYSSKKTRGAFIAAVFAMQGFGIISGGIVAITVSAIFNAVYPAPSFQHDAVLSSVPQADYVWRIILMFGALPALLTYYSRMKMPETARYTALVAKNTNQAASDMSKVLQVKIEAESDQRITENLNQNQFGLFSKQFLVRHGLHLLGTAITWFLLDIAFYSQNLFQKDIFTAIGWLPSAKSMNAIEEVYKIARAQTLIALCSTVPGYWFTVAFIDRIGRFKIQLMGFFFMTVFMVGLAIPYDYWLNGNQIGFVIMYSFTFFFCNFGPNATTFVVPAEIFPARLRSTCHGISAASGKAGAIVGAFGFLYTYNAIGMRYTLFILAGINFLGLLFTFLVPEPKGRSLEEISEAILITESEAQMKKSELIFIPSPGIGHLVSALEFAKRITNRDAGVSITVLCIKFPFTPFSDSYIKSTMASHPQIQLIDLPEVDPPSQEILKKSPEYFIYVFMESLIPHVKSTIQNILSSCSNSDSCPFVGLVLDFFCMSMLDVGRDLGIPSYLFLTTNAGFLAALLSLRKRQIDHVFSYSDPEELIPGFSNLVPPRVLPNALFIKDGGYFAFFKLAQRFTHTKGIIVNTFSELEQYAIDLLSKDEQIPPIYTVGPVIDPKGQPNPNLDQAQHDKIIKWLDDLVLLYFFVLGAWEV